jgi:hypothetical protein
VIEFGPDDGESEEVLAAGPQRPPRGLGRVPSRVWAGLAVAVLVVGALVTAHRSGHDGPRPVAGPTSAGPIASPATTTSTSAGPSQATLDRVTTLANLVQPEFDTETALRPDARCAPSPADLDPEQSVATAVRTRLPEFTLVDSGAVLSPQGTMCDLLVRLRDASGAMLIVQVGVPPHAAGDAYSLARSNDRTTVQDVAVVVDGWQVQVGWVGQTGADLGAAELTTIARDPKLRW